MENKISDLVKWATESGVVTSCSLPNSLIRLRVPADNVSDSATSYAEWRSGVSGELVMFERADDSSTSPPPAKRRRIGEKDFSESLSNQSSAVVSVRLPRSILLHPRLQWSHPTTQRLVAKIRARSPSYLSTGKLDSSPDSNLDNEERGNTKHAVDPFFVLALWFLIEERRDPSSKWRAYLDCLPKEFDCSLYWSPAALDTVKGTNLYEGTQQINAVVDGIHHLLRNEFGADIERSEVLWAYTVYSSRSFCVYTGDIIIDETSGEARKCRDNLDITEIETHVMNLPTDPGAQRSITSKHIDPALLPLADIFNHSNQSRVRYVNDIVKDEFRLEVHIDTSKPSQPPVSGATVVMYGSNSEKDVHEFGSWEVCNNYGPKSNEALLLSYGFMLEDNPYNTYWVQLGISDEDPNKQQKLELLKLKGCGIRYDIPYSGDIPREMLATLRILLADSRELYAYEMNSDVNQIISFRNEIAVYTTLRRLLESRLNRMLGHQTITLQEVEQRIANIESKWKKSLPTELHEQMKTLHHQRMGLKYRLEQQVILQRAIGHVEILRNDFQLKNMLVPNTSESLFNPYNNINLCSAESWLKQALSIPPPYSVKVSATNDGVAFSVENIQDSVQNLMITINEDFLITADWILSQPSGLAQTLSAVSDIPEDFVIALFVASERRNPNSPWKEYWSALPSSFSNALYFTDEQLECLSYTLLLDAAMQLRERFEEFEHTVSSTIYPKLLETEKTAPSGLYSQRFSQEELRWAMSVVLANAIDSGRGDLESPFASFTDAIYSLSAVLVPLFGQFHHRVNSHLTMTVEWNNGEKKRPDCVKLCFVVNNDDPLLYSSYNDEYLEDLVARFGIFPSQQELQSNCLVSPQTEAFVQIVLGVDDESDEQENEDEDASCPSDRILNLFDYYGLGFEHYIHKNQNRFPEKLMSAARLLCLTIGEANVLENLPPNKPRVVDKISDRNEEAAKSVLAEVLRQRLELYSEARDTISRGTDSTARLLVLYLDEQIFTVKRAFYMLL